jgi:hypothetical protein
MRDPTHIYPLLRNWKKGFVRMGTISRTPASLAPEQTAASRPSTIGSAPHKGIPAVGLPSIPTQNASIYEHALWYHALGFNVVPLERPEKGKTKKPTCKWKGWQSKRQDRRDLAALHRRRTQDGEDHFAHGILAIDGVSDIRHFDLDQVTSYEEAVAPLLAALGLPKDYPWIVQSGSGKGYHLCFRCSGDITTYFLCKADEAPKAVYIGDPQGDRPAFDHLELRWQAALTTLPPSRHWTGGRYTFVNARPTELPPYIPLDTVIAAFHQVAVLRQNSAPPPPASICAPSAQPP